MCEGWLLVHWGQRRSLGGWGGELAGAVSGGDSGGEGGVRGRGKE